MASETQRRFIAENAGRHGEHRPHEAERDGADRRVTVACHHERPECDDPGAHPVKLEAVRAVPENVTECGAVAEDRAEIEEPSWCGCGLMRREAETDGHHDEGTDARDEEGTAPPE